jgi:hypothetical protein
MSQTSILLPTFAHVLLTIAVMIVMGVRRSASMREKGHTFKDIALGQDVWSEAATKAARNYANQFEMPVLFHAACAMALAAKAVDSTFVYLAWAFIAARVVHTVIHLGNNSVSQRAAAFVASAIVVLAMWIVLVLRAAT